MTAIERFTIEPRFGNFRAYGWGAYPQGSVLEGHPFRQYITEEISVQRCRDYIAVKYPGIPVEVLKRMSSRPEVSLSHLPDGNAPR